MDRQCTNPYNNICFLYTDNNEYVLAKSLEIKTHKIYKDRCHTTIFLTCPEGHIQQLLHVNHAPNIKYMIIFRYKYQFVSKKNQVS